MNPPNNHDHDEDDAAAVAAPANIVRMRWRLLHPAHNNDDDAAAANNNADDDDADEGEDPDDTDIDEEDGGDEVEDDNVFDPAEGERICQEALTLLQNRLNLPSRLRDRTMVLFAQQFINNVKEDIHKMVTDRRTIDEGYDGLDSERDTEEEVETALRCGPEVLSREDEIFGLYPILCLTFMQGADDKLVCNVRAVSFVHLFVQLAIELNSFPNEERGGLLIPDPFGNNVLHYLMLSPNLSLDDHRHQHVDTMLLAVLIRLRRSGYLVQEDIQQYSLMHRLCRAKYLPEQRFRFLTECCPSSLLRTNEQNELPFHFGTQTVRKFRVVLDTYIRYYPKWKGLHALFSIDNGGLTPLTLACEHNKLTHTKVMKVVEDSLVRYTTNESVDSNAALILAATDDTISLDGVYFIIRRQPDKMLSMLRNTRREDEKSRTLVSSLSSSSSNNHNTINTSTNPIANRKNNSQHNTDSIANANHSTEDGHQNENHNKNSDDSSSDGNNSPDNNRNNGFLRRSTRKRKRN